MYLCICVFVYLLCNVLCQISPTCSSIPLTLARLCLRAIANFDQMFNNRNFLISSSPSPLVVILHIILLLVVILLIITPLVVMVLLLLLLLVVILLLPLVVILLLLLVVGDGAMDSLCPAAG